MATTTNYGWTTPDDTALVKDGAAAIRTLGSSVDTTTKALNPSTTLGDIEYRSATANTNTRLAIGTTGQVLTVAGGVPTWASAAGGGGKVLQVVQGTTTTGLGNATTTYADTTLTATITPSASTSKVLVLVAQNGCRVNGGADQVILRITRAGTQIFETASNYGGASTVGNPLNYLDSPATTSATVYKTQFKSANTNNVSVQASNDTSSIILLEIGA